MNHRRMATLTLLMKHIRQRDMMEQLDSLPRVMVEWISPEQGRIQIQNMVNAGEAPAPELIRALAERLPQHEDELITIGMEKGIQLGEQRGIEKGRHEGKLEVARTMLQNGLDCTTVILLLPSFSVFLGKSKIASPALNLAR